MSTDLTTTENSVAVRTDGEIIERGPDAAEARTESVSRVLDAAYQKASRLNLKDEEAEALMAPFPDSAIQTGAGGKANLLYLEHASIRARLFQVFGPGRWALICRKLWAENYRTSKGGQAVRVYADCVLIVRGCYVGEAVGAMSYYPTNDASDYSDAADGAQSFALRKIAGKYLGVGLQLWNRDYCDQWKARQLAGKANPPAHPSAPPEEPPYAEVDPNGPNEPLTDKGQQILRDMIAKSQDNEGAVCRSVSGGKASDFRTLTNAEGRAAFQDIKARLALQPAPAPVS